MSTDQTPVHPSGLTESDILGGARLAQAWFGRSDAPVCSGCELPASEHERPFGMADVASLGEWPVPEDHGYEPDTDRMPGEVADTSDPETQPHPVSPITVTLGGQVARHLHELADQLGWSLPDLME